MGEHCHVPNDPLDFIRQCVRDGFVYWTYHVNMRLRSREISRSAIIESLNEYEVIEAYPEDKYLPSYLVWTEYESQIVHVLFAVDLEDGNIRVVTAYHPDPLEWCDGFRRRKER